MAWGRRKRGEVAAAPRPERVREGLRLSPNEERYVLAETLTGQVYAVPSGARFKGPLPFDKLMTALQETCDRHEARRTGYERAADGTFTKYVEARATLHLERLSMPGATDAEIMDAVNAHTMRKGDLSPGELHRYVLIELGPDDHVFAFALHHATADGVSFGAFVMEVYARLLGFPVADTPPQYSDVWNFDWTTSDAYRQAEAFWRERLDGIGDPGGWPADRPRGHSQARLGETVDLPADMVARTRAAAAEIGVTPFTYFYAVYQVLLSRMIGSDTVVTTFQSAGRKAFPGAERTLGVFSNSLIVAGRIGPDDSIATIARRLRADVKSAIAHEIYPYHHAIRATGVRARYAMNWMPAMGGTITFDDIEIIPFMPRQNQDDDDLNLRFGEYDGLFHLTLYYDPSAYDGPRVAAQARQLAALADELARDVNRPVREVRSADLAPTSALPDPTAPLPDCGAARIFDAFLEQARATPQAVAISHAGADYSYADVEARSRSLAQRLRASGVGTGDRVAIVAERGPQLVWSTLGVARSGAAFAVLDAAYPEPRLAELAAACAPAAYVRAGGASDGLARRLAGRRPVLDAIGDAAADGAGLDAAKADQMAYVLFTSGTTGRPKAVVCSHGPLVRFIDWHVAAHGLNASDRFGLLSGLAHDPVLRDVLTPLSIGARIAIPEAPALAEPGALARWINTAEVSVAHLTPQMGRLAATGPLPSLRRVFWGGDQLPRERVTEMARLAPAARQVGFYGTTETPQAVAACALDADMTSAIAPLGRGVAGAQLLVVDAERRPLGIGELGEIAVRSRGLSMGRLEQGRLATASSDIFYTGDLGLHLPDGSVMWVGRRDDQLKVRGHRVEPGEVAAALLARPEVREAVVLPTGDGAGMAAFVAGRGLDGEALRAALAARLPAYMVPTRVIAVERIPVTPNGKADRAALLRLLEVRPTDSPAPPLGPPTAMERSLIEKWTAILGDRGLTPVSTFAAIGGDSLSYVQVYLATEEVIGDLPEGWPQMTIAELAKAAKPGAQGAPAMLREVDSAILVRAAAVALVVAHHFNAFHYGGGATSALLLISGFLFGGMGLSEVFRNRSAAPAFRVLRNLFVPLAVMAAAIWLFRLPGDPPQSYVLLMTADLQDWRRTDSQDLYLWFAHALLHILAFVAMAAGLIHALRRFDVGRWGFLWGLFALGCVGRFVVPGLIDPTIFTAGPPHVAVDFLPTTHLATFVLGGLVACAETAAERRRVLLAVVAYALASVPFYGPGQAVFTVASGLLLMFRPRVAMPQLAAVVVFAVAGGSLWIYLTHMMVRDGLTQAGLTVPPLVGVALALSVGALVWKAWSWAMARARDAFGRVPSQPATDAVV